MAAEADITDSLFADMGITSASLIGEKQYTEFGKKVGQTLFAGSAPYRIPMFFKELTRDLNKHIDSGEIKDILDSMTAIYNEKVKQEKEGKGGPKKQTTKASLKAGKIAANS